MTYASQPCGLAGATILYIRLASGEHGRRFETSTSDGAQETCSRSWDGTTLFQRRGELLGEPIPCRWSGEELNATAEFPPSK